MPEGHKTHFFAREHTSEFAKQRIKVTSPQGRFRADARKVNGKTLRRVEAYGKHLFYEFDSGQIIHIHLGRYGSYAIQQAPPQPPRGQIRMRMIGKNRTLDLRGPTQCRVIDSVEKQSIFDRLGPDPLAGGRSNEVWETIRVSSKPIGTLLLDQAVVAGIGNIFRAEILFEIGMSPNLRGDQITPEQFEALWKSTTKMMKTSLKYGQIISVTAKEVGKPLAKLGNRERFRVYSETQCPRCGGRIAQDSIGQRKMYWCKKCQVS